MINKPVALFICLWKNNFPLLIPYLQRHPRSIFIIPTYQPDAEVIAEIEKTGSRIYAFEQYYSEATTQEGVRFTKAALTVLGETDNESSYFKFNQAVMMKVFEREANSNLQTIFADINNLQALADEFFIEAILINEEAMSTGKTFREWAKRQGIPLIHVTHGTCMLQNYEYAEYPGDHTITVFGQRSADFYFDCGVPASRLQFIGNPVWNEYKQLKQKKQQVRKDLCSRHRMDADLPIIVFGTSWCAYLSASDDRDIEQQIRTAFDAYKYLTQNGIFAQFVIKDRKNDHSIGEETVSRLITEYKIPKQLVRYVLDDTSLWVTAADVVISIDSNLSYEAVLAETPAINLLTSFGMIVGPAFSADDPILQCEASELGSQLHTIISSVPLRAELQEKMRRNTEYFKFGDDGKEAERFCALLEKERRVQPQHDHNAWLAKRRPHAAQMKDHFKALLDTLLQSEGMPVVHVVINAVDANKDQLLATLNSLQSQMLQAARITVVSGIAMPDDVDSGMIEWQPIGNSWAETVNELLFADATCNWALVVPAGYTLEPQLLLTLAEACSNHPQWRLVYMNEDTLDAQGHYSDPLFRPDMNLELLLSNPYLGDVVYFKTDTFSEVEGFGKLSNIENHQLALRMLAGYGEGCVGHSMDFYHRPATSKKNIDGFAANAMLATREYLESANADAEVRQGLSPQTLHVVYKNTHGPLVSVLIAVGEQLAALNACLSGLMKTSEGCHFEIIIGIVGATALVMEHLDKLKAAQPGLSLTVVPLHYGQTLGEFHNVLAQHARGELLLFLYHDAIAISDLWLDRLSALCNRPDVVAIAPRLVSFGSRLRSKVALTDMGENIHISLAGLHDTDPGYMGRAHSTQALQQLSPGCLMVNAQSFREIGGFNQDGDDGPCVEQLCVLLRKNGGKLLWTPNVTLVSCETISPSGWPA